MAMAVANRTLERGEKLAGRLGAEARHQEHVAAESYQHPGARINADVADWYREARGAVKPFRIV